MVGLLERNRSLVADLSHFVCQQEELKKLNQYLQIKIDDALSRRNAIAKEFDSISQQYHPLKSQYMDKVS